MKIEELRGYLSRKDVPLETRISTLTGAGLPASQLVDLGESLIKQISPEEKNRCKTALARLERLITTLRVFRLTPQN